jgi:ABC-2 type transport system ATP-binding protein
MMPGGVCLRVTGHDARPCGGTPIKLTSSRPAAWASATGAPGIPPERKAGKLSGGQQAQLAPTLALARRPRLLVLDEPVAMLDPVARHDLMATVLAAAAADGVSVLLSSHVLTELERVASYLVLLSRGQVRLAGEVGDLLARHRLPSLEELAMAYLRENLAEAKI